MTLVVMSVGVRGRCPLATTLHSEPPFENRLEEEEAVVSADITEPFDPTRIRMDRKTLTINLMVTRIQHGEINLSPDFQRRSGIWNKGTQSRLIESILLRIPLPAFYVDAINEEGWIVIDGLQRLTTLKNFVVDKTLALSGLEFLEELKGKTFDQLPRMYQRRIEETEISIFSIEAGTSDDVKFTIFKRINTGGLPLSTQEIRNALNGNRVREFLNRLTQSDSFRVATSGGIRSDQDGG